MASDMTAAPETMTYKFGSVIGGDAKMEERMKTLPFTVDVVFEDGRWRIDQRHGTDMLPIYCKKGMIVHKRDGFSVVDKAYSMDQYLENEYGGSLRNEKVKPVIVFYPSTTPIPREGRSEKLKVIYPDWLLDDERVWIGKSKDAWLPKQLAIHASKKLHREVKTECDDNSSRCILPHTSDVASKFVTEALQGRWSVLPLSWGNKLEIASIVFKYDLKTLYDETMHLLGTLDLDKIRQLTALKIPNPEFEAWVKRLAMQCLYNSAELGTALEVCVAVEESRKRQRVSATSATV